MEESIYKTWPAMKIIQLEWCLLPQFGNAIQLHFQKKIYMYDKFNESFQLQFAESCQQSPCKVEDIHSQTTHDARKDFSAKKYQSGPSCSKRR